ncbi:MAG: thioesterase family protein [bacterium]|nr:thioesterase family protein [bacterium]
MKTFTYHLRVPFYDVDSMRVVYHGNYTKYFEEARCAYFESLGLSYNEMEASGFLLPVISLNIKYIRSCTFAQELAIEVKREANDNLIILHYLLRDAKTGVICCKGKTRHAAIHIDTKALLFELPPAFLERLKVGEAQL